MPNLALCQGAETGLQESFWEKLCGDRMGLPRPLSRFESSVLPDRNLVKLLATFLAFVLCATALAQNTSPVSNRDRATVEGIVTKDPDSQPVKKVLIELIAENQTQGGDYTVVTGADGAFRIENVIPGRYHLFAERTGLMDLDKQRGHGEGRVLTLSGG